MRKLLVSIIAIGTAVTIANCSPYSPDLGNAPYLCAAAEPFCPGGYTCQTTTDPAPRDRVCVSEDGTSPDAAPDGAGFPCADDSSLGMNDAISGAYQTPVDTQRQDLALAGLAICPEGDRDHYAIVISGANKGLEVVTSWDSGMPVSVSILNAGGSSIGNGVAMGAMSNRACVTNLPVGTYYASAFAGASTKNNYRLSIKIVANCAL